MFYEIVCPLPQERVSEYEKLKADNYMRQAMFQQGLPAQDVTMQPVAG